MCAFPDTEKLICGPFRSPRQMLADQEYGGHKSLHDDDTADVLGFSGAPIEGPTHMSQFVPLLHEFFGQEWYETGCISVHYQNMCVEGDEVRAFVQMPATRQQQTRIFAEKRDGTPVLVGTASIGADNTQTELERKLAGLRPADDLFLLSEMKVGQTGKMQEHVIMKQDQHMGILYPFSLQDKLAVITEGSEWYRSADTPWGQAIIPLEMISVLTQYTSDSAGFYIKGPSVGLFADQEIRMVKGPLFVDQEYALEREIIALSESRRTESYWVRTSVLDIETGEMLATTLLNHAILKDSYENYRKERYTG